MMVPYPDGEWKCYLICNNNDEDFQNNIAKMLNDDWEMQGNAFVNGNTFCQVMTKFIPVEYEEGDDDDGLPLPEAENEPIEKMRNCS